MPSNYLVLKMYTQFYPFHGRKCKIPLCVNHFKKIVKQKQLRIYNFYYNIGKVKLWSSYSIIVFKFNLRFLYYKSTLSFEAAFQLRNQVLFLHLFDIGRDNAIYSFYKNKQKKKNQNGQTNLMQFKRRFLCCKADLLIIFIPPWMISLFVSITFRRSNGIG